MWLLLLLACGAPREPEPTATLPAPALRRLTQAQYRNAVHDVLGADIVIPTGLEPDEAAGGLFSIGAAATTISPRGVEQYEAAAYQIADQVTAEPDRRAQLVPCTPASTRDDACAKTALEASGRRLWRRPLSEAELATHVEIAGRAAETLGDFYEGLEFGLATQLQSPAFLFRAELGAPASGGRDYDDWELAARLSFFLWNTTPDDTLLTAAAAGDLTGDGYEAQVDRMLSDPRARQGVRNLFTEQLQLYNLDTLTKDPLIYLHMSADVGPSAREQTLADIEQIVFDNEDWRTFYTSRRTHLNRKLAALYDVRAPARDGFGVTELPEEGPRAGFLGQVSFLALAAHPTSSSATLRGKFVQQVLLCNPIPAPPANVNTMIPEPSPDAPTLRDRVRIHLTDPFCASCHRITDPIGLGFEHFDGLGSYRAADDGATLDVSGELEGKPFNGAVEIGHLISEHPKLAPCLARTVYQYANGRVATDEEDALIEWYAAGFAGDDDHVLALLRDIATSQAFRHTGDLP
jgi:hypothetical protein